MVFFLQQLLVQRDFLQQLAHNFGVRTLAETHWIISVPYLGISCIRAFFFSKLWLLHFKYNPGL